MSLHRCGFSTIAVQPAADQLNRTTAFTNVFQTPQAKGMPIASHASSAPKLTPPNPMPAVRICVWGENAATAAGTHLRG
jgi:hypothetical protein